MQVRIASMTFVLIAHVLAMSDTMMSLVHHEDAEPATDLLLDLPELQGQEQSAPPSDQLLRPRQGP